MCYEYKLSRFILSLPFFLPHLFSSHLESHVLFCFLFSSNNSFHLKQSYVG